jgi:hypothetical protein
MIALTRDGFHEDSQGGTVTAADDGSPVIDYPMTSYAPLQKVGWFMFVEKNNRSCYYMAGSQS